MNISRNFLVIGAGYLLVGILLGMYMGGSGDHSLTPVHAHINLLGFTLMTLFAICYKVFPALASGMLATAHFWLHQAGTLVLLGGLYLMMSRTLPETTVGPIMPIAEGAVFLGILAFAVNAFKNVK